jgi:hypothetical protein
MHIQRKNARKRLPSRISAKPDLFPHSVKLYTTADLPSLSAIYADDLVVFATGKNLVTLEEELQDTLRNLEAWSHSTGFHFSSEKTKNIVFNKRRTDYTPILTLYNQAIEKVPCIRFLGVIFDSQLTWKYFFDCLVMNQVGNSKFPPSGHLIFFLINIRNENKTREIQKWPRARDRTSLISLRCVFFNTN